MLFGRRKYSVKFNSRSSSLRTVPVHHGYTLVECCDTSTIHQPYVTLLAVGVSCYRMDETLAIPPGTPATWSLDVDWLVIFRHGLLRCC